MARSDPYATTEPVMWPGGKQSFREFAYQINRRFLLLWLAITCCLLISGVAMVVAIRG